MLSPAVLDQSAHVRVFITQVSQIRPLERVLGSMFCAGEQISFVAGTALQYIYGLYDSTSSCNGR